MKPPGLGRDVGVAHCVGPSQGVDVFTFRPLILWQLYFGASADITPKLVPLGNAAPAIPIAAATGSLIGAAGGSVKVSDQLAGGAEYLDQKINHIIVQ